MKHDSAVMNERRARRLQLALRIAAIAAALLCVRCGWSSSCNRPYVVEDVSCTSADAGFAAPDGG